MRGVTLAALGSLCVAGCGSRAPSSEAPPILAEVDAVRFGRTWVGGAREQRLGLRADASRSTPFELKPRILADPGGHFEISAPLEGPLEPGRLGALTLLYRPCPTAWRDGRRDPDFDLEGCALTEHEASLALTPDLSVPLIGAAGRAPRAKLRCPAPGADAACPSGPPLEPCTELDFGRIPLGEPCSVPVVIVNARDTRGPTAALAVTSLTLRVRDETQREVLDGVAAGFSVEDLEASGAPPSTSTPWLVPIPEGEAEGRRRLRITVTPRRATRLIGAPEQGAGLRFGTDDPASPELVASLHVTSELPQVRLAPLGPVQLLPPIGGVETQPVQLINDGPDPIRVRQAELQAFSDELSLILPEPLDVVPPGQTRDLEIRYERRQALRASGTLWVRLQAPLPSLSLSINREDGPRCEFGPRRVRFPEASGRRAAALTVGAPGNQPCLVTTLDIEPGPNTRPQEFEIARADCAALPCRIDLAVCPAADRACAASELELPLTYLNQDASTMDEAVLVLTAPDGAETRVPLFATDDACAPPEPMITVRTEAPCVGRAVRVDGLASTPGGPPGTPSTISQYRWSYAATQAGGPSPLDQPILQFIPTEPGPVVLRLDVANQCGAWSDPYAAETLSISSECPE